MFNIFHKKTQVEALIAADGIDHVADRFAEIIARKLTGRELAYQFILQELDGAHLGNAVSQVLAKNSGIHEVEYRDARGKSMPEIDGPEGPQQLLLSLSLQITNRDLMAEFRCRIDDKIMRMFKLGKYAEQQVRIERLMTSLKNILMDDKDVIPAFTRSVPVPASAKARHIHNREKNIASARALINQLSAMTGDSSETLIQRALCTNEPSPESDLNEKKEEIGGAICEAVNQYGKEVVDQKGAVGIVNETLQKLTNEELLACKTSVACLFAMAHVADSASRDDGQPLARYISKQCKPIAAKIMQLPNNRYSDLELTMVDTAFEIMKKIDDSR